MLSREADAGSPGAVGADLHQVYRHGVVASARAIIRPANVAGRVASMQPRRELVGRARPPCASRDRPATVSGASPQASSVAPALRLARQAATVSGASPQASSVAPALRASRARIAP